MFSKFVIFLVSPLGAALCLGALALLLAWRKCLRAGFKVGLLALLWLWL